MTFWRVLIAAAVIIVLGIGATTWWVLVGKQTQSRISVAYPEGVAAAVPLGISAGQAPKIDASTANPLAGDANAVQQGRQFFLSLNCAGCHGYNAKGNMGPDLTDAEWRYGGRPIEIYKSIYEGRPQGMPAWGNMLPSTAIWDIVAYVQSLGGALPPAPPEVQAAQPKNGTQSATTNPPSAPTQAPPGPSQ